MLIDILTTLKNFVQDFAPLNTFLLFIEILFCVKRFDYIKQCYAMIGARLFIGPAEC